MIELRHDRLEFSFPDVHPLASMSVGFQRTLRIPDDASDYPLPPGLGAFPLRHVDDHAANVPAAWVEHGGVMLPMYQSEALWLYFQASYDSEREFSYPFALVVSTGKVNAVSGQPWTGSLDREPQNYLIVPHQPWLDGYCVEKGIIRQFVAMPLGAGYSAEEQVTGKAEHGGLQILAIPMKRAVYEKRFPKARRLRRRWAGIVQESTMSLCCAEPDMGLAPGGRMRQEIYDDPYDRSDWDTAQMSRCFVHIANSLVWREITGKNPPTAPPTAKEYTKAGLPWFEWYDERQQAVPGSQVLAGLKSVAAMGKQKGDVPLPENQSVTPSQVVKLRAGLHPGQVREFAG